MYLIEIHAYPPYWTQTFIYGISSNMYSVYYNCDIWLVAVCYTASKKQVLDIFLNTRFFIKMTSSIGYRFIFQSLLSV